MSRRRVQLVILCEDIQHRAFAKGLFEARGFRNIRFLPIPEGKGAATQYIFERYPNRVKAYRILAQSISYFGSSKLLLSCSSCFY